MSLPSKDSGPVDFKSVQLPSAVRTEVSSLLDTVSSQLYPKIDIMVEQLSQQAAEWKAEQITVVKSLQEVTADLSKLVSVLYAVGDSEGSDYLDAVDALVDRINESCESMLDSVDSISTDAEYYNTLLDNLRSKVFPTPDLETQILMGIKSESLSAIEDITDSEGDNETPVQ